MTPAVTLPVLCRCDDESSGHGYRRYSYDYDVHHHDHYYDGNPFDDEAHEVEYEW